MSQTSHASTLYTHTNRNLYSQQWQTETEDKNWKKFVYKSSCQQCAWADGGYIGHKHDTSSCLHLATTYRMN